MNDKILKLNMQYFAEEDASAVEIGSESTQPESVETTQEEVVETPEISMEEFSRLKREMESALLAREKAEKALEAAKRTKKQLERANMTEQEQLEDQKRELQEQIRDYNVKKNKIGVQEIFVNAGLQAEQYDIITDLIVSDDPEKSISSAKEVVTLINLVSESKVKNAEAEWMKRTPTPPSGEEEKEVDPFVEAFDRELAKY